MTKRLNAKELAALTEIDTPTICNTLDILAPDYQSKGFIVEPFFCLRPEMKPIVGYAKTATCRAIEPSSQTPRQAVDKRHGYWAYLDKAPKPAISVVQDLDGAQAGFGAFWGEVNSTIHQAFGCLGTVTNGSIRDLDAFADGFQAIAGLVGPSHAHVHLVDYAVDVNVLGMVVRDGDLVHADCHGAVVIPDNVARDVVKTADLQARREAVILDACRKPGFTLDRLKKAYKDAAKVT
ncbi:MAG: RraA family protein [Pseudomonadota bacterium]